MIKEITLWHLNQSVHRLTDNPTKTVSIAIPKRILGNLRFIFLLARILSNNLQCKLHCVCHSFRVQFCVMPLADFWWISHQHQKFRQVNSYRVYSIKHRESYHSQVLSLSSAPKIPQIPISVKQILEKQPKRSPGAPGNSPVSKKIQLTPNL